MCVYKASLLWKKQIQEYIAEGMEVSEEEYEMVTLLFADIVGFTAFSESRQPKQVVEMLSKLFTEFDKECDNLNLYKVYTIGDCYVVMSFIDKSNRKPFQEEASDMIRMGFSMIKIIEEIGIEIGYTGLHMRIGIHTGNIFGGVLGTDIVRFDIYGQNVLIANKMESNGEPDCINVSESTHDLVESFSFTFEENKEIELKSINRVVKSYFVKP
jgi:class 3 adenylate cyclase